MLIYSTLAILFFFLLFSKSSSNPFCLFSASFLFVCILSLRSAPDEYLRYMQAAPTSLHQLLSIPIYSDPLYQALCLIFNVLFSPTLSLKLLYIVSYSLPFFAFYLISRTYCASQRVQSSFALTSFFYVTHPFIVLCYTGIRTSFALGLFLLALWAASTSQHITSIILLFCTLISHIQFLPVCTVVLLLSLTPPITKFFKLQIALKSWRKYRSLILVLLLSLLVPVTYTLILPLVSSSLPLLLVQANTHHVGYLTSKSYGYALDISSIPFLLNITSPLALYLIIFCRNHSFKSIPQYSLLPFLGVLLALAFSSYALFSYRISFTFYSVFLFLVPRYFPSIGAWRRFLLVLLSLSFLIYNVLIAERFSSLSF